MSQTQEDPPRASNGRFVQRKRKGSRRSAAASGSAPAGEGRPQRQERSTLELSVLTVAIILGVLGFAVSFLWAATLVVLAMLWGVMVAERKQRLGSVRGLASELVTTLADEAKGVMEAPADRHAAERREA